MRLKQFFIPIACVVTLILIVIVLQAVWVVSTKPIMNCTSQDLSVSSSLEGATGSLADVMFLTNVSDSSCYLPAPKFSLVLSDSSGTPLNAVSFVSLPPETLLSSRDSAPLSIVWSNWCGAQITQPVSLVITLSRFSPKILSPLKGAGGVPITDGPRCDNTQASSTLIIKSGPFN